MLGCIKNYAIAHSRMAVKLSYPKTNLEVMVNRGMSYKAPAARVKVLRDLTGASLLDVKKSLEKFEGDEESAKLYLREKNLNKGEKRVNDKSICGVIFIFCLTKKGLWVKNVRKQG